MTWERGSTRAWRRVRRYVLERDGFRCRAHADGWCAKRAGEHACSGAAPLTGGHAHHTLGRAITGDDPRHIVAACSACNLHIGDPGPRAPVSDPRPRPRTKWGTR